jgi:hypothetical protein
VAAGEMFPPDANMLISPREPTSGALGAFAKFRKLDQIRRLEQERVARLWEVHAVVSDHVPLGRGMRTPPFHALRFIYFI